MRGLPALLVVVEALGATACQREPPAPNEKSEQASVVDRRVEKLRQLITLPAAPSEVWFEVVPRGTPGSTGPTDYVLVAVLRFDRSELAGLTRGASRLSGSPAPLYGIANRSWFPPPIKAAIHSDEVHGSTVRGVAFDGAPFARSPFLDGSFIALDGGDYVLLVLSTT